MSQPNSISEYRVALRAAEAKIARLEAENAQLKERVRKLEGQLEAAQRAAKRQAAPFSRGKREPSGRPPGRRSGAEHGRHAHRQAPERVDEELYVELPEACPNCGGGELEESGEGWEQYQEELPEIRARVTRVSGKWARCRSCGRRVRGRHPRQTSEATGAAAAQVGPRALAFACSLNKEHGLSVRKTTAAMRELGIRLSPGGLVQAMARLGDRCRPTYRALVEAVRQSPVVIGDETGWHVNGDSAWLWIMTSELLTVYGIREGRGFEEAASLLGAGFAGVLVRDGWAVYRKFVEAEHQTCLAHLLRRCREMCEATRGRGREVPKLVTGILKDALALRDRHQAGEVGDCELPVAVVELEVRMRRLLSRPAIAHPGNRRLLKHLSRERDHLFTFLHYPELDVPATNWRAEQGIRPAVMIRKTWGGNATWSGARTQECLMSVCRTGRLQGVDVIGALTELQRQRQPGLLPGLALPAPGLDRGG
jgi:transposase